MHRTRQGFTLVEMLVAMALTIFIMVIISQAFVAGLDTFRGLKAIGDMQASLRTGATALRDDLAADHFEAGRKLSDGNIASDRPREGYFFIRQGNPGNPPSTSVPEGVDADGLPSVRAADQVIAFTTRLKGNKREHYLMSQDIPFYVQPGGAPPPRRWSPLSISNPQFVDKSFTFWGQDRDALFNPGQPNAPYTPDPTLALQPGVFDTYAGQWAEVAYFLIPTGSTDPTFGTPLFGLYRAQHLLVPNTTTANKLDTDKQTTNTDLETYQTTLNTLLTQNFYYSGVSCFPRNNPPNNTLYFNSPEDVANQAVTRVAPNPPPNVVVRTQGMENRVLNAWYFPENANSTLPLAAPSTPSPLSYPAGTVPGRPPRNSTLIVPNVVSFNIQVLYSGASDFSDVAPMQLTVPPAQPVFLRMHDTTLSNSNILGLKITIRVFDPTTKQTRQISMVQDM